MKRYRIKEPVYKLFLDFFTDCTEREMLDYLARCNEAFNDLEEHRCQGRNISNNKYSVIWIDSKLKFPESMAVISHELIHHVLGGLNQRGIPINFKNEEVIAYLHEYFLREIIKRIIKKWSFGSWDSRALGIDSRDSQSENDCGIMAVIQAHQPFGFWVGS